MRSSVAGFLPSTRRELSPRPMPSSIRPPLTMLSVAKTLASTVTSRTAGLVTQGPMRMRLVEVAIRVISGVHSFQRTCESKIHPYSNPAPSA